MTRARDLAAFVSNADGDIKFDTDTLFIDSSADKVGIGTTSPSSILHIEGNTNEYASSPILYFGSTSTANAAVRDWAIGPADDNFGNFHIFRGTSTGSNPIGNDGRVFTMSSSGNVGIGNASPDTTLYVDCGAPSSSDKTIATFQSQTSRQIGLFWDDSASNVGIGSRTNHEFAIHINGNSNPRAIFKDGSHCFTNTGYSGSLSSSDDGTLGTVFHLSGQQYWQRNANAASSETLIVNNIHSVGADIGVLQYRTRNVTEGSIFGDGTGITISNVSDYRKKENVTNATGCLDKVVALRPVTYTYKEQYTTDTSKEHLGLIAHEVADVMPTMVKGEKDAVQKWTKPLDGEEPLPDGVSVGDNKLDADGNTIPDLQSLSYSHNEMITNLIGAIKELKAENDAMRTRLDALESE